MGLPAQYRNRQVEVVDLDLPGDDVRLNTGEVVRARDLAHPKFHPTIGLVAHLRQTLAAAEVTDGVMIALVPPADLARKVGEVAGDMSEVSNAHVTIAYLGKVQNLDLHEVKSALTEFEAQMSSITCSLSGWGSFPAKDGTHTLHCWVESDSLKTYHHRLVNFLGERGIHAQVHPSGYKPHMTVGYHDSKPEFPDQPPPSTPFSAGEITLAFGTDWQSFRLGSRIDMDDSMLFEAGGTPEQCKDPQPGFCRGCGARPCVNYKSKHAANEVEDFEPDFDDALTDDLPPGTEVGPDGEIDKEGNPSVASIKARARLARTAARSFSPDEQRAVIEEGRGVRASNHDRARIEGTHYEAQVRSLEDPTDLFL